MSASLWFFYTDGKRIACVLQHAVEVGLLLQKKETSDVLPREVRGAASIYTMK